MVNAPSKDGTYTILQIPSLNADQPPTAEAIKSTLEKGSDEAKIDMMKRVLVAMLNGDFTANVLMHVIRFVMPSKDKKLKKLCHLFWEICPKTNPDGKLKAEMILVCNALRNELQHPNEYVRGSCLRFLCKLRETELLEPLVPSCRANLEHRHPYVRRTAILAIYTIYKHFPNLLPDAPDLISSVIITETDQACRRNALIMLQNCAPERALSWLDQNLTTVANFDESLQQVVVELLRRECRSGKKDKPRYVRTLFVLLERGTSSVRYEAASSLSALSSSLSTIKAVANCYIQLALKEPDNNVKMIVLDRLVECHRREEKSLEGLHMDLLKVLHSSDVEVRRKCLDLVLTQTNSQNAQDVVKFLQEQLRMTLSSASSFDKATEYRQMLIRGIHKLAIAHSQSLAGHVVPAMVDFMRKDSQVNQSAAVEVVAFVREVMAQFADLRPDVINRLLSILPSMKSGRVLRGGLWILGEYSETKDQLHQTINRILASIGDLPIRPESKNSESQENSAPINTTSTASQPPQTKVLPDGSYKTEINLTSSSTKSSSKRPVLSIRNAIFSGDYFSAAVLATTITKLHLRLRTMHEEADPDFNHITAQLMLVLTSILRVGQDPFLSTNAMDEDAVNHFWNCFYILSDSSRADQLADVYLADCQKSFTRALKARGGRSSTANASDKSRGDAKAGSQADDPIRFRFIKAAATRLDEDSSAVIDYDALDVTTAMGGSKGDSSFDEGQSKLNRIVQLTGFSDLVYAEAVIHVHQYDILFDVLIVNQTSELLQNVVLELATLGDLKLVERPTPSSIEPYKFHIVKANVKVSSTETGVVFGNIVYDGSEKDCVILDDIHVDIMDYIRPASCDENTFRSMWTEFEWENKVNVNTTLTDSRHYLDLLLKATNMRCLTPERALEGNCDVLAANLYARSIFGEDALANICIERQSSGVVSGHIRIRSKTQGIALSLGDKITLFQRNLISEQSNARVPQLFEQLMRHS